MARALWLLVPEDVYPDGDERRRAQVLAAIGSFLTLIGAVRATVYAVVGLPLAAVLFAMVSISGVGYVIAARRRWNLRVALNVFAVQIITVLVGFATYRGGIEASVVGGLAVLPMILTFTLGVRTGVVWWGVSVLVILGLGLIESIGGLPLSDQLAEESVLMVDTITAIIIPTAIMASTAVYEWTRLEWRRAAEQEMERRIAAERDIGVIKADKMSSIGLLAAGVGHEINNPLTYVQANVEYVLSRLERDDPTHSKLIQALSDAKDGVGRIARITADLSTFARSDRSPEVGAVSMVNVAKTAVGLTRHQVEHRAKMVVALGHAQNVLAVESRLVQVAVNLLLNAVHAVEDIEDGEVVVRTGTTAGSAWLEVSDNGAGVPGHLREKIFDPFFTTKPVGVGTGLGLSTSRSLVEAVGGTLSLVSPTGQGTTFRMSLPSSAHAITVLPERHERSTSGRYRLLVVDDEPMFERAITRMLAPNTVVWCSSVEEAIAVLDEDTDFDLVLSDVMMYPMAGWELLNHIQRNAPTLARRFAFMTGGAFSSVARQRISDAKVPVVTKPFGRPDIVELIRQFRANPDPGAAVDAERHVLAPRATD